MSGVLKVDLAQLGDTAAALKALVGEFDGAPQAVAAATDALGSTAVASALGNFADDWSYHRSKLVGLLTNVAQMAASSQDTYTSVDRQLGQQVDQSGGGGGG